MKNMKLLTGLSIGLLATVFLCACSSVEDSKTDSVMPQVENVIETEEVKEAEVKEEVEELTVTKDEEVLDKADEEVTEELSETKEDAEKRLVKFWEDNSGIAKDKVVSSVIEDFDRNGTFEAFIFSGEYDESMENYPGIMWYTDGNICKNLNENDDQAWWDVNTVMEYKDRVFLYSTEYYATGGRSLVWGVYDGEVKEASVSGLGSIALTNDHEFTILDSQYDATYDDGMWMGHTWKPYYFYYDDAKGEFREYGGINVEKDELNDIIASDFTAEFEQTGNKIIGAFYRGNGIVNVNYSDMDEVNYGNVNYDCKKHEYIDAWGDGNHTMENSDFGGMYRASMLEEIAVYPDEVGK